MKENELDVLKITLDTTAIRDIVDNRINRKYIEKILDLQKMGKVSIAVSKKIWQDVPNPPLSEKIDEVLGTDIEEILAVGRFDVDLVFDQSIYGSEEFVAFEDRMKTESRSPGWKDMDHVHTHFVMERDIFVTSDKGILALADELLQEFEIVVCSPEDFEETYQEIATKFGGKI